MSIAQRSWRMPRRIGDAALIHFRFDLERLQFAVDEGPRLVAPAAASVGKVKLIDSDWARREMFGEEGCEAHADGASRFGGAHMRVNTGIGMVTTPSHRPSPMRFKPARDRHGLMAIASPRR